MNTTYKKYPSIFWFSLLCTILLSPTISNAQVKKTLAIQEKFELGPSFGDRHRYKIDIDKPGRININVIWEGTAAQLALILNGPGQKNYYARKDGESPMKLEFAMTSDVIAKGKSWTISIINFGNSGSARGVVTVDYPVNAELMSERQVVEPKMIDKRPMVIARTPQEALQSNKPDSSLSQENTIQRTILEDGTVQIRYPDGTIKHVFQCGYMIFKPDGTSSGVSCNQVQPTTPPSLPGDDKIIDWLDWQAESLLDLIKVLLEGDVNSIENYVNKEAEIAPNIYQKMYVRTNYINRLLSK